MALLPAQVDYTEKDFEAIRARFFLLLESVFPTWTDQEVATFGNLLVELFAHVGDKLLFYQDNQAREAFIPTARLRRNMLALAKTLGYSPRGRQAATADVLFTLNTVPVADVTIPAGQLVWTRANRVQFRLLADLTIPAFTDPPQAFGTVENSEEQVDSFISDGSPDQEFALSQTPFVDDSVQIVAANGAYTQVTSLLQSSPTDRHFTVTVDDQEVAFIRFGGGQAGEVPVGTVTIEYKTGGGAGGRVEAGSIAHAAQGVSDELGNPVTLIVTNPEPSVGGQPREPLEEIRVNAPANLRVGSRTVALEDYEIGAELVPGCARALMLTSDQQPGFPENRGFLYVVPDSGGLPTDALKEAVQHAVTVTRPKTVTFRVEVKDPVYKTADISATVWFKPGYSPANGKAQIVAALQAMFALKNSDGTKNTEIDFGANVRDNTGAPVPEIPLSDIMCVIEDQPAVRKVGHRSQDLTINGQHQDLPLLLYEFPRLGTITIIDGATGQVIP